MEERIIKEINALLTQLFSKMKEAGYEWDKEKKELKKIDSCESDLNFKIEADKWYVCIKDYYYSDIDELMFTKGKAYKAYIDWGFISNNGTKKTPIGIFPYKEYFRPATDEEIPHEQKPAWSEEDDQYLLVCKNALAKYQVSDKWDATIISRWLEDKLKSLKDRVQPVQEWNGSDDAHLHSIITHLQDFIESHPNTTGADIQGENVAWLKSLRPQNRWKPSDEQMEALYEET